MLAMTRPRPPRTSVVQLGHAQAMEIRLDLARSIRDARRDSGLTARQLAAAAGVGLSTVRELETAGRDPGLEVMARLAAALGGRLRTWMEPGAGPLVHDRYQGAMLGALLAIRHRRWGADTEVLVREPIRGVIDAVLEDELQPPVVAVERANPGCGGSSSRSGGRMRRRTGSRPTGSASGSRAKCPGCCCCGLRPPIAGSRPRMRTSSEPPIRRDQPMHTAPSRGSHHGPEPRSSGVKRRVRPRGCCPILLAASSSVADRHAGDRRGSLRS